MRRITVTVLGIALLASACQENATRPELGVDAASASAATGMAGLATYEVTVTNLTGGQPFTPPLAVTHRRALDVFEVGQAASAGVQQIAENGDLAPLSDALSGHQHVADLVIALDDPPPILPGGSRTFTIDVARGARYLSFVSMLICTNDGFTGLDSVRLPRDVGDEVEYQTAAYDAGTETNTEDFADLVPPCPGLTGVETDDPGTGASDPALAENGVIHMHEGIMGGDDLDPGIHGWTEPVAEVTIIRVS